MVSKASPDGQIPDNDLFAKGLDAVKRMFTRVGSEQGHSRE